MSEYFDRQGTPISVDDWGRLFEDRDYQRIDYTEIEGGISVSTVWLGLNHNYGAGAPVIFETMIFCDHEGYPYEQTDVRYPTEVAAREGHARTVADLVAGRRPWFLEDDD